MKSSQLIIVLNEIIQKSGDVDINVQITTDGATSNKLIEGIQYVYDGDQTTVILVPILE